MSIQNASCLLGLAGLAGLAPNGFSSVSDALALVRFGRTHAPNPGGFFTNGLLVNAQDRYSRVAFQRIGAAVWWHHPDRVRKTNRKDERLSFQSGAISHSLNLEITLVAVCDPDHHIVQQRSRQSVKRAALSFVVWPRDDDCPVVACQGHG